jgi:cytidylate kinase
MNSFVVAIDGPAAAGKGTLARALAHHFKLAYLDTGALYRAVARDVLAQQVDPQDFAATSAIAEKLDAENLSDPRLRSEEIGRVASIVAAQPPVRAALLEFQRRFAARPPGAILDGRDVGTVVCPDAPVKLFVTAAPEVRARRRVLELQIRGEAADEAGILAEIRERDARDSARATAPLKPAGDAILLDTSDLDAQAVLLAAVAIVSPKFSEILSA